jgi:hypothetical protein
MFNHDSDNMESTSSCNTSNCPLHFHAHDTIFVDEGNPQVSAALPEENRAVSSERQTPESAVSSQKRTIEGGRQGDGNHDILEVHGFRRIIRNFTPS